MALLSLFFDVGGRLVRDAVDDPFFTVGGIAVETTSENVVRSAVGKTFVKWKHADANTLHLAAAILGNPAVAAAVVTVEKTHPWWDQFWDEGKRQHRAMTSAFNTRFDFARPGVVLRYWAFRACAAVLLGGHLRRCGLPRVLDQHGLGILRLKVICDTDIQGDENRDVFRSNWEAWAGNSQCVSALGVQPSIEAIEFREDHDEPLLALADVLAGFAHAQRRGIGARTSCKRLPASDVEHFALQLASLATLVNLSFREVFPNLTGDLPP